MLVYSKNKCLNIACSHRPLKYGQINEKIDSEEFHEEKYDELLGENEDYNDIVIVKREPPEPGNMKKFIHWLLVDVVWGCMTMCMMYVVQSLITLIIFIAKVAFLLYVIYYITTQYVLNALLWQNLIKWSVDIIYKCIISFVFGNI
jgi:hypothetical protein